MKSVVMFALQRALPVVLLAATMGVATKSAVATDGRPRFALIITNQAYTGALTRLDKTHEDGKIVAEALKKLGFAVDHGRDLGRKEIIERFRQFGANLRRAHRPVGFFYFAGHGLARRRHGDNYLVPVDAKINRRADLSLAAVKLGDLIDGLPDENGATSFMAIDACRSVDIPGDERAVLGLSPVAEKSGLFISFSTSPGEVAVDANHFSKALAANLQRPNVPAYLAFRSVRRSVFAATDSQQFPWMRDGLLEEFYFNRKANDQVAEGGTPSTQTQIASVAPTVNVRKGRPTFRDSKCANCPEMVAVQQQSASKTRSLDATAQPPKTHSFAISRFEVTFDEWEACVRGRGCRPILSDNGWGRDSRPVINVSWYDAQNYVRWLSKETGKKYRLPTEEEWMFAARSGKDKDFEPEDGETWCRYANGNDYNYLFGLGCEDRNSRSTSPVGSYASNGFGLNDMSGNVWEWVDGCWDRSEKPDAAEQCPRVLKGGSWKSPRFSLKASARRRTAASHSSDAVGFRVARTLGPE